MPTSERAIRMRERKFLAFAIPEARDEVERKHRAVETCKQLLADCKETLTRLEKRATELKMKI